MKHIAYYCEFGTIMGELYSDNMQMTVKTQLPPLEVLLIGFKVRIHLQKGVEMWNGNMIL